MHFVSQLANEEIVQVASGMSSILPYVAMNRSIADPPISYHTFLCWLRSSTSFLFAHFLCHSYGTQHVQAAFIIWHSPKRANCGHGDLDAWVAAMRFTTRFHSLSSSFTPLGVISSRSLPQGKSCNSLLPDRILGLNQNCLPHYTRFSIRVVGTILWYSRHQRTAMMTSSIFGATFPLVRKTRRAGLSQ